MMRRSAALVTWLPALALAHGFALAQSIHDAGVVEARVRTELAPGVGTAGRPLQLTYTQPGAEGCLWGAQGTFSGCPGRAGLPNLPGGTPVWGGTLQAREACGGSTTRIGDSWIGCIAYDTSPYFALNNPGSTYWAIHANDDPSYEQCHEGPPGLSHPIASAGVAQATPFKFDVVPIAGARGKRLRMTLSLTDKDFFCSKTGSYLYSIPFLSVGAQGGRGNPGPVGHVSTQGSPHGTIVFEGRLSSYQPIGCKSGTGSICSPSYVGVHAGLYALARLGGVPHMLFLDLYGEGVQDYSHDAPSASGWNWPVEDSFFYPGARVLFFTAGARLSTDCGITLPRYTTDLAARRYKIDFGALLACAQRRGLLAQPLPAGEIALDGVHWYVEGTATRGELGHEISQVETALMIDGFD